MSFCMNCGAKLNDGDAFCSTCGSAVNSFSGVQNNNINNVKTIQPGNKPLAVIALVFAFICSPIGLIISIVAVLTNRHTDCKVLSIVALIASILMVGLIFLGFYALMVLIPQFFYNAFCIPC